MTARPFMQAAWDAIDPQKSEAAESISTELMMVLAPLLAYWPKMLGCPNISVTVSDANMPHGTVVRMGFMTNLNRPKRPKYGVLTFGVDSDAESVRIHEYDCSLHVMAERQLTSLTDLLDYLTVTWTHTDIPHDSDPNA